MNVFRKIVDRKSERIFPLKVVDRKKVIVAFYVEGVLQYKFEERIM